MSLVRNVGTKATGRRGIDWATHLWWTFGGFGADLWAPESWESGVEELGFGPSYGELGWRAKSLND